MSEQSEHENLKKQLQESYRETFDEAAGDAVILPSYKEESSEAAGDAVILPRPIKQIKESIDNRIEAEAIGRDFLEQLQPIVETRRRLREAEEDLAAKISSLCTIFPQLIASLSAKVDAVAELKRENMQLEREVLTRIKNELNK